MYQNRAECDVCSRVKKETNHWYLLARDEFVEDEGFNLIPWVDAAAENGMYLFLCSAECITKMLNQFLERKRT